MKSADYYLNRAAEVTKLADGASSEEMRNRFLKAAEAYMALAETARRFAAKDPAKDKE